MQGISHLRLLQRSDRGASLVEYALLVALIAIVCIVAVTVVGSTTGDGLDRNASSMFVN